MADSVPFLDSDFYTRLLSLFLLIIFQGHKPPLFHRLYSRGGRKRV